MDSSLEPVLHPPQVPFHFKLQSLTELDKKTTLVTSPEGGESYSFIFDS